MIEFNHVSKTFGDQQAVSDLNLHFSEGSFSVLIGTSGSGKSTTLKMINRLVEHDSGTIRFAGEEIRSLPVLELRRRMGYAIQSIGLFPHWTVAQNIAERTLSGKRAARSLSASAFRRATAAGRRCAGAGCRSAGIADGRAFRRA
ncbi:ABC transporter ATP-binding protein [Salmonella enterica subsp. enterica serovar Cerro str. FSL R8-0235]|nr:ABC transporter ATP-binding protein [Salmonella enterica subsp. enterica serovar Cerro str. FSL R8-0235]